MTNPQRLQEASGIRIAIAEDHELSLIGLSHALSDRPGLEVVLKATSGSELVNALYDHPVDVILMDLCMPGLDGIEATRLVKKHFPEIKVIILTGFSDGESVYDAMSAGADGYCMKDVRVERLAQIIELVLEGSIFLDRQVGKTIMDLLPLGTPGKMHGPIPHDVIALTSREKDVLLLISKGMSNREISEELKIAIHTVKVHVCNILQKLSVDDRTQAAIKALRDGLL